MFAALSCALAGTVLAAARAAAPPPPLPTWFGVRADPSAPTAFQLVVLDDGASVASVVGPLALGEGEVPYLDAMRCLPGFCILAVAAPGGGSALYRVAAPNATTQWRAPCSGRCANVHYDIPSESAIALSQGAPGAPAAVLAFAAADGAALALGEVALAGATVGPGQTSHCSATRHLYVGVARGGARGGDAVLSFSLADRKVDASTALVGAPLPAALWAACDASLGFLGGVFGDGKGALSFGVFAADGSYNESARVAARAGLVPTGLLTATSDRGASGNLFLATARGAGGAAEAAWVVDPWGTGKSQDELTDFAYDLIAASWVRCVLGGWGWGWGCSARGCSARWRHLTSLSRTLLPPPPLARTGPTGRARICVGCPRSCCCIYCYRAAAATPPPPSNPPCLARSLSH